MAFKKYSEKKGLSLPGMIDMVFLLLIFSLVTLSISDTHVEKDVLGDERQEMALPEMKSPETKEAEEILHTLMIQIEHLVKEDNASPKVVFILKPGPGDFLSIEEAKQVALRDSLFAIVPEGFLDMDQRSFERTRMCRMIRDEIREYKERHFLKPAPTNSIQVRAVQDTEFRLINFIMTTCSAYGDTIPGMIVHTVSG